MKKIILLPLDERPCNNDYPVRLFSHDDIEIIKPGSLGNYKTPADHGMIRSFLLDNCSDADAMVISLDMLIYGGLVPSRLHHEKLEELQSRMEIIKEIRKKNPDMLIYAFQCIMRCPEYSSSEEEPDYYGKCGEQIHDLGAAVHRMRAGEDMSREIAGLRSRIDREDLDDYITRRDLNREMNIKTLKYLQEGYIDSLVIPRDDSQEFGYPSMDEEIIRRRIHELDMTDRVLMYPGADEVELTLIARIINKLNERKPKVYVKYASSRSGEIVPLYEGCALATTIKYHILSAGCQSTESYEQADIILVITAPSSGMQEAMEQPVNTPAYCVDRLLIELIDFIRDRTADGKIVTIGDDAYANGGDLDLIHMLDKNRLLMQIGGYAGWNTNANTIGTALAEAVDRLYYGKTRQHDSFLTERYLEDGGYCSVVRQQVAERFPSCGVDHMHEKKDIDIAVKEIGIGMKEFLNNELSSIAANTTVTRISLPWDRLFEVNLEAEYRE